MTSHSRRADRHDGTMVKAFFSSHVLTRSCCIKKCTNEWWLRTCLRSGRRSKSSFCSYFQLVGPVALLSPSRIALDDIMHHLPCPAMLVVVAATGTDQRAVKLLHSGGGFMLAKANAQDCVQLCNDCVQEEQELKVRRGTGRARPK